MIKKIRNFFFTSIIFGGFSLLPVIGVEVRLPLDRPGDEININSKTQIRGDEDTLYKTTNLINEYLRWSFGVIAFGLTVYAGYEAISANGDSKVYKKVMRTFIGIAVGLAIAMLSSALVKVIINWV